jgi:hypothetical protein
MEIEKLLVKRNGVILMIKNIHIYGLEESIKGAKFPMSTDIESLSSEMTKGIHALGMSDIGSGHDNWLNGVTVIFDLTATNKFWVEMERYHFMNFISSQSTMHRITKFDLSKTYNEYVDPRMISIMKEKVDNYNRIVESGTDEEKEKLPELYLSILYSNPAGFTLTAKMTTNYRQLKTIYRQRRDHQLPEWHTFCEQLKTLPYSEFITMEET